jgi:hypothetical protein
MRVPVVLALAAILAAWPAAAFQVDPAAKKPPDKFLHGAPFTFEQVLRMVSEKAIPPRRQRDAIRNRGLDFSVSPDDIEKLSFAGASPEMIELIRLYAKPLPPPPPVKTTTERIVPATNLGRIVSRAPSAAKEGTGAELFRKMLQALGGEAFLPESLTIQAEGVVTIWDANGRSALWNISMHSKPGQALFQVRNGEASHEVVFEGSQFKTSKGLQGDEGRELPADFSLIRDHQIAVLVARLNTPKFKFSSDQNLVLIAESDTETVSIRLDGDLRPAQVKLVNAAGLGSRTVAYADYVRRGNVYYPRSMQIKPDSTQRGIDLRFDRVD